MSSINYFDQDPPSETPLIFAPGMISTDAYEFAGTFSPDGNEFFFTRRPTYEGSNNRIFFVDFWTENGFNQR